MLEPAIYLPYKVNLLRDVNSSALKILLWNVTILSIKKYVDNFFVGWSMRKDKIPSMVQL